MKTYPLLPALVLAAAAILPDPIAAQDSDPNSSVDPYAEASKVNVNLPASFKADIIREKDGKKQLMRGVFLFKTDAGRFVYADNPQGARFDFIEPATIKFMSLEFTDDINLAMQAYEDGNPAEALPLLEKAVTRYQALRAIDGSPVPRMEIMRMDSLRKTKKFDLLRDALVVAKPDAYDAIGKDYLLTLPAWDAHSTKDWNRIEALSRNIDNMAPGIPAAEFAYLRGEALRRLDRKPEALAEYHRAMSMDFTRSRAIFGDAALGALAIYEEDPLVKEYFSRFGSEDYNPEGAYVIPAKEAAYLAHLVRTLKPGDRALATNQQKFLDAWDNFEKAKAAGGGADNSKAVPEKTE